jgi:hypothetical protein
MSSTSRSTEVSRLERFAVIQSLSAGTVPAVGLRLLQVGRQEELKAIEEDLRRAEQGISSVRFISGPPESGKTFFLNLIRTVALERGFVVLRTDLSPARRLHSAGGEARALYRDLIAHMATKAAPDGLSMGAMLHEWIERLERESGSEDPREALGRSVRPLHELSGGFDFAMVLAKYQEGRLSRNDQLRENALRWLRAEYTDKMEAQADLGVRSIIDDDTVRDALALFAAFARLAGHAGLVVIADDLTSLTRRLKDSNSRRENYDAIVDMLGDCLDGRYRWLVMLFGVEDSCVDDRQRGLYSNPTLATWLAPNRFASNGHRDLSAPVIRLRSLKIEDYPALLSNIRDVFAKGLVQGDLLPEEGVEEYIRICHEGMGQPYFDNPREVVKDFIDLLHLLAQNPSADWRSLLEEARPPSTAVAGSLTGYPDDAERGTWPGWYTEQLAIERHARWRNKLIAAILLPMVMLGIGWGTWLLVRPPEPVLSSTLTVKYSDVLNGLRNPIHEDAMPLTINNYMSVEADPSLPCYLYVMIIDSEGRIVYTHGKEAGEPQRDKLQLPGEDRMFPVLDPEGTRIVLLLGSPKPVDNLGQLKIRVQQLQPRPNIGLESIVRVDGERVEELRPPDPSPAAGPSDLGYLKDLQKEFGAEFPIVRAVAFPVVKTTPRFSPNLNDLDRK